MKNKIISLLSIIMLFTSLKAQTPSKANTWSDYNEYIAARMKEWNIPGMAIAIVKGDSIILQNTYGYADVANRIKVSKNTLFALGSCTKFFTTTGLSILADENKLDFNAKVTQYFPALVLQDTLLQNEIIMKDILSHRTGLERGDYIWYGSNFSADEIISKLKYLKKAAPIRTAFIYNNMMYTLAGKIIEKQSGMPYQDFIKQRLFIPLKLNNTFFDISSVKNPYALPYLNSNANYEKLPMPLIKGVEPAGAIWSDLNDMTTWIKFHLRNGKVDTTQLVSKKSIKRLKTPIHFTGSPMKADESELQSYGLGMGFTAYKGYRVMYHTGVAGGYTAHLAFLPEQNVGVIILTNNETYTFPMMNNIFDRILGLEQTDWNTAVIGAVHGQWQEAEKEKTDMQLKIKNSQKIENQTKYTGVYAHQFCQPIEVLSKANKLYLKYNAILYELSLDKEGKFMAYDPLVFGEMIPVFQFDKSGNANAIILQLMGEELAYKKSTK